MLRDHRVHGRQKDRACKSILSLIHFRSTSKTAWSSMPSSTSPSSAASLASCSAVQTPLRESRASWTKAWRSIVHKEVHKEKTLTTTQTPMTSTACPNSRMACLSPRAVRSRSSVYTATSLFSTGVISSADCLRSRGALGQVTSSSRVCA